MYIDIEITQMMPVRQPCDRLMGSVRQTFTLFFRTLNIFLSKTTGIMMNDSDIAHITVINPQFEVH